MNAAILSLMALLTNTVLAQTTSEAIFSNDEKAKIDHDEYLLAFNEYQKDNLTYLIDKKAIKRRYLQALSENKTILNAFNKEVLFHLQKMVDQAQVSADQKNDSQLCDHIQEGIKNAQTGYYKVFLDLNNQANKNYDFSILKLYDRCQASLQSLKIKYAQCQSHVDLHEKKIIRTLEKARRECSVLAKVQTNFFSQELKPRYESIETPIHNNALIENANALKSVTKTAPHQPKANKVKSKAVE